MGNLHSPPRTLTQLIAPHLHSILNQSHRLSLASSPSLKLRYPTSPVICKLLTPRPSQHAFSYPATCPGLVPLKLCYIVFRVVFLQHVFRYFFFLHKTIVLLFSNVNTGYVSSWLKSQDLAKLASQGFYHCSNNCQLFSLRQKLNMHEYA